MSNIIGKIIIHTMIMYRKDYLTLKISNKKNNKSEMIH